MTKYCALCVSSRNTPHLDTAAGNFSINDVSDGEGGTKPHLERRHSVRKHGPYEVSHTRMYLRTLFFEILCFLCKLEGGILTPYRYVFQDEHGRRMVTPDLGVTFIKGKITPAVFVSRCDRPTDSSTAVLLGVGRRSMSQVKSDTF